MQILDGQLVSQLTKDDLKLKVAQLKTEGRKIPHLAAILVGANGASETYVGSKVRACNEIGYKSTLMRLSDDISEFKLLSLIEELNVDPDVDGILVQLPLPKHISDEKVINANITKALYLADGSAKTQYDNLKETGYYANVIAGNISQQINIDSVQVNTQSSPIYFHCWASIKIIRPNSIVTRNLLTQGYLRNVSRSDHNPHGFLIERWETVENKDLKTESR